MATKYTVYKVTDADRTKKIFSIYADTYEIGEGELDFYQEVITPGGWFKKDTSEDDMVASFNTDTANLFVVREDVEVK